MEKEIIKILIIDDDDATNFLTSYLFNELCNNCDLTFETSAENALLIFEKGTDNLPDVIMLDINMPGMNGWDFLNEYQKHNFSALKKIPIFMLSTSIFDSDKIKSKTYPEVVDYIEKPFNEEKIKLLIDLYLKNLRH